jgi:hypothetical protein
MLAFRIAPNCSSICAAGTFWSPSRAEKKAAAAEKKGKSCESRR